MLDGTVVLVTGATGRLGRDASARLEALGATVLPIILEGYPDRPLRVRWTARCEPRRLRSPDDLAGLPHPDWVLNFHWRMDGGGSFADRVLEQLGRSVHRPSFLWEWLGAAAIPRFVNISSIRVFGRETSTLVSAATLPAPTSPYGVAKLAAEHIFSGLFADTGTAVLHIRLGSVFAHGEHPSKLVTRLASSAFEGTPIPLNTENRLHLAYIDEAIDRIIDAAHRYPSACLTIAGRRVRIGEIASVFESISSHQLNTEPLDPSRGETEPELIVDKAPPDQSWIRATSLNRGIERFIAERQSAHGAPDKAAERNRNTSLGHGRSTTLER